MNLLKLKLKLEVIIKFIFIYGFCNLLTFRCIDSLIFSQYYNIKKLIYVTNNMTNKILNIKKILSPQNI
jgi:hypothetical protein